MRRDEMLELLRRHMPEIRSYGVSHLAIFGSVARGEERPDSDVDILIEYDEPFGFFELTRLQRYLEGIMGRSVDLVTPGAIRPEMRDAILGEALYAA